MWERIVCQQRHPTLKQRASGASCWTTTDAESPEFTPVDGVDRCNNGLEAGSSARLSAAHSERKSRDNDAVTKRQGWARSGIAGAATKLNSGCGWAHRQHRSPCSTSSRYARNGLWPMKHLTHLTRYPFSACTSASVDGDSQKLTICNHLRPPFVRLSIRSDASPNHTQPSLSKDCEHEGSINPPMSHGELETRGAHPNSATVRPSDLQSC